MRQITFDNFIQALSDKELITLFTYEKSNILNISHKINMSPSKNIITFILFSFSFYAFSQKNELLISDLKPLSYAFTIENNQITGAGADTLKSVIQKSQFFMLGEEHRSPQISKLTNVLLPYFDNAGYDNLALEVGPFTADIIKKEIKKNNSLYELNHSFYLENNDIPIPFFDGKDDDVFIKTASKYKFKFWGLDQEYITAPLFLLDEIFKKSAHKKSTKDTYLKAKAYLRKELDLLNNDKGNNYYDMFLGDNPFANYIKYAKKPAQKNIIEALKTSMHIYKISHTKLSNELRSNYMKRNFSVNYNKTQTERLPKVLIKMGSMHLGWGKSWLDIYDLGNMVNELAVFNNTRSTSINCFSRYVEEDDGTILDYIRDEDGKNYALILELATKDQWVLVDSKKIMEVAKKKRTKLNAELSFLLSRYDYILLAPLKTKVLLNY